ncbi:SMC-Scp complex subunit ScpB [Soehngenia longivitae]|uniref:Segregation and condensation protein B n=1 Tax=Soehngenia longivitae TaxID=2562294 RepID=A0A4Z0D4E3_9FIRM|nr:SMC-Scp complex subunit ScpB [Soehngenia longivitae]TFZ39766.1 SMC-Scp complex subunit ScpB [Soehngenia longivitae]
MDERNLKSIIEGLLFAFGDPLEDKEISKVVNISVKDVNKYLQEMKVEFEEQNRGIRIIKINNSYQLSTRPEHYDFIKAVVISRNQRNLSNASLETLSIIAYKQPITKMEIDEIRGVKSDKSIETLMQRKLIREIGRLDRPGKPILYGTSDEFLKFFGIECIEDLPNIEELRKSGDKYDE